MFRYLNSSSIKRAFTRNILTLVYYVEDAFSFKRSKMFIKDFKTCTAFFETYLVHVISSVTKNTESKDKLSLIVMCHIKIKKNYPSE